MRETREIDWETQLEVRAYLDSFEDVVLPTLSRKGLDALRDIMGSGEVERMGDLLDEDDVYTYARRTARAVCSVLVMMRMMGGMNPLDIALNAAAIGYERGVLDACEGNLSNEACQTLAAKVDDEERGGREVERFRRELEGL